MALKPTSGEIEAYYFNDKADSSLPSQRFDEVEAYVRERFLDGRTRQAYIEQRRKVEEEIARLLDS